MKKTIATERKVSIPNFKMKLGTLDKKSPKFFYFEGGTYITPTDEDCTKKCVEKIERRLRRNIGMEIPNNEHLENKYILDTDVAYNRLKVGRPTFFGLQCFLSQGDNVSTFDDIEKYTTEWFSTIMKGLEDDLEENNFTVSVTR